MADWNNQNAVLRALRDWQTQQDVFGQFRQQQRFLDEFRREQDLASDFMRGFRLNTSAFESVRQHFATHETLGNPFRLRQIIDDLSLTRNSLAHLSPAYDFRALKEPWESTKANLESALRFFPPHLGFTDPSWDSTLKSLRERLEEAPLLGEAFIADADAAQELEHGIGQAAGQQLIEVAPAGALADLEAVSFSPLRWLDAALRDPEVLLSLESREFETFTAALVERLGMKDVFLTPAKGDGGRDVIGTVRSAGLEFVVALECKRYSPDRPVGVEYARALLGTISHGGFRADKGVLVTTSRFTSGATSFILTAPQLDGVDFDGLKKWLADARSRLSSVANPITTLAADKRACGSGCGATAPF